MRHRRKEIDAHDECTHEQFRHTHTPGRFQADPSCEQVSGQPCEIPRGSSRKDIQSQTGGQHRGQISQHHKNVYRKARDKDQHAGSKHGEHHPLLRTRQVQRQLQALALHLRHELHESCQHARQQRDELKIVDEDGIFQHHHFPDVPGPTQGDGAVHTQEAIGSHTRRDQHGQQGIPAEFYPLLI